jgi:hypothetical protein
MGRRLEWDRWREGIVDPRRHTMPDDTSAVTERASARGLGIALVVSVAVIAVMVALTAIVGVYGTAPVYDIAPDPAPLSGLPF